MPHNLVYEFGPYRLDANKRVLTCSGETVSLTPKATDILIVLVRNAGELVEKEELLKAVWPNTFVEEANLAQNIFMLRQVLRDERVGARYIETVTRRGYRFVAQVRTNESLGKPSKVLEFNAAPIIAVLPFANSTRNEELEYLVDGLTDNIINNFSRVSKLRVMSRSTVLRYKARGVDPQTAGKELGASAVLVGKISARRSTVVVSVELVDVATGWQLWGKSFDNKDLLDIQSAITREVLTTLKLELTGAEEKRVTARYTESAEAYQAYLEGRYYWSQYTKKGIEKAIKHFRRAIDIDPNYALAYAGIVDCYLRLATNYLPPEEDQPEPSINTANTREANSRRSDKSTSKVKLRFEWDWKSAERELRRAHELRVDYPGAHQWHAASTLAESFWEEVRLSHKTPTNLRRKRRTQSTQLPTHIPSLELTANEQVQVYCAIAREQIEAGNYDAACVILQSWWQFGTWPKLDGLNQHSCADLLFTTGELAGCVGSTQQLSKGQKHGEALLSGSIALWEQLGSKIQAAEGRIELALCYYRQGLFDLAKSTLINVLSELSGEYEDLRSLALIRLACLERHAGRLQDALTRLNEAAEIVALSGPWATGRRNLELATTYTHLFVSCEVEDYSASSQEFYSKALHEFEAVGNHRLVAVVENNLGYLLLKMQKYGEAEYHLLRARRSFNWFNDKIRCAQVDDSLARLYLAQQQFDQADETIERALQTMELGDEDALLAEALTTRGIIYCRSNRQFEAKRALEDAHRIASRCGDNEGAGRALLILMEELPELLEAKERNAITARLVELLASSTEPSILRRLRTCVQSCG